jgi:thioredoxin-like negative regulator of GroEL
VDREADCPGGHMTRKWIVIPVVGFGLIAGSVGSYAAWNSNAAADAADESSGENEAVFGQGQPAIQAFVRSCTRGREAGGEWLAAEVEYAVERHDTPRLLALYTNDGPYRENEQAALLTCRGLLLEENLVGFRHLRDLWHGREGRPAAWLALDADVLIRTSHTSEARALLSARSFPGSEDAGRLARLALTTADGAEAAELMARAEALAPTDADVSSCRARLIAASNRSAAAADLTAALAARPDDWTLRCQLADCLRRGGDYEKAVNTWMPAGEARPPDFAWLRAWFWNRVGRPVAYNWELNSPNGSQYQQLADYLLQLQPDQFWDTESGHGFFTRSAGPARQETYWLKLLALLQAGREDDAATLLRSSTFHTVCWQPDLEQAIVRILDYRAGRPQRPSAEASTANPHPFFEQLERLATDGGLSRGSAACPDDVAQLLDSKEAFSAALLAAGWDEGALRLHHQEADLTRLPGWFNEALTRAMWSNRSALAALNFTLGQPKTPGLDLVAGELLVYSGREAEALPRLRSAAAVDSNSSRAAWLLAETALRQGCPAEARRALESHPQLTANVAGQMLLARAAAAEGDAERADMICRGIADQSTEARAYLARRAASSGDWEAVGQLAGSLLQNRGR